MAPRSAGSIFALGIDYSQSPHPDLPESVADARRIEEFFHRWGYAPAAGCRGLVTAEASVIRDAVEKWSDALRETGHAAPLVLYLAGHGRLHHGRHYTLAATSPGVAPYSGGKAISADDLVERILNSGAGQALVLLDVCHAGFAAHELQRALDRATAAHNEPGMDLAVLASCLHHEKSYTGMFVENLLTALREGSQAEHWRDGDQFVTVLELRDELRARLRDEQCAGVAGVSGLKLVPNPRYHADAADRVVELGELLKHLPDADREHFLRKAASTDASDVGWFFSGRDQMSRDTVAWLDRTGQGVLVVTGAPGAGKSAFLGRLAILADPASQRACRALGMLDGDERTRPEVGAFGAVAHLKNRRVDEVAADIATQLGVDLTRSSSPARDPLPLS